ncbi:hypothetical protein [Halosimplex amylolyticum]|uniref:hypothetical protein n=1 Tax=Halosimplex amylolyticum TaxID=3396616 RepID=UPI003F579E9B
MERRTVIRRAALGLLTSGAALALADTNAATTLTADRTVNFGTTTDATALLSVENIDDADTVPLVTNRTGHDVSVTLSSADGGVEFDVGDDGNADGAAPTFALSAGADVRVDVLSDGTTPVTFEADLLGSAGDVVGSITFQRDVETRSQAGQVDVTANVTSVGNSGKYEFELENTGSIDVTLVGIGIRRTSNPAAVEVAGGDVLFVAGYGSVVNAPIPVDSDAPDSDTRRDFTADVALDQGQTLTFRFDRFKDADGKSAKMKKNGDTVDITLYFDDGSELDKRLQP